MWDLFDVKRVIRRDKVRDLFDIKIDENIRRYPQNAD